MLALFALCSAVRAADGPAEEPEALIFLDRVGPGAGAPTRTSVEDFLVLSEVQRGDPYHQVVKTLTKGERAEVLTFDRRRLGPVFEVLARRKPGMVAVVIRPESLDVNFHFEFLERASRLDADPFVDFTFGYLTGATAPEAVAFAEGIRAASRTRPARSILEFGPSRRPQALTGDAPHSWAEGFRARRLAHPEDAGNVPELLRAAKGTGVLSAWGHGMPEGVAHGMSGKALRESGLDLHPALYFSGPCYCGVTGRWFGLEGGVVTEKTVAAEDAFVLALIKARVSAAFAGLDPDRGETNHHELDHVLLTGEPLGMASKSTYDDVVVAYRRPELKLPRYEVGKRRPYRDIHDNMISGSACRALFGDPRFQPFPKAAEDPFRVDLDWTPKGLVVTWKGGDDIGKTWMPVDINRAGGSWTHRLRLRFELPLEKASKLKTLEVLSVTKDGKDLAYIYPTAALETWGGKLVVHVLIVFPVNARDRALWNGKEFVARLRFSR
jgi:hypothetical protein